MASGPYSFIDIAVIEEVRARFAAGDALAILSVDLDEVIWANGRGAALLGHADIESALGASSELSLAARRQIAATRGFPHVGRDRTVLARLASGLASPPVPVLISGIALPDGDPAVLLAVPVESANKHDAAEIAERAVEGFSPSAGYFAAIVTDSGAVPAASEGFSDLAVSDETLAHLVEAVRGQHDRLVKRMIAAGGRSVPAAIARLTDEPAVHLLIVVDEPVETPAERAAEAPAPAEPVSTHQADLPEATVWRDETPTVETTDASETREVSGRQPEQPDDWYFSERSHQQEGRSAAPEPRRAPTRSAPSLNAGPVRFVWRTDEEGRFSALSDEFVEAVGANAADVIGRRFRDVAAVFGLDADGEIASLLERRDTWSGRTVLWPVQGTELRVPVDLAALPVYDRNRTFEGFRGFGVARLADAVSDPEALGLTLVETETTAGDEPSASAPPSVEQDEAELQDDPFSGEVPALSIVSRPERRVSDKVIRLAERRPQQEVEGGLSPHERTAFQEIGNRLKRDYQEVRETEPSEESGGGTPAGDAIADAETEMEFREAASENADQPIADAAGEPDEGAVWEEQPIDEAVAPEKEPSEEELSGANDVIIHNEDAADLEEFVEEQDEDAGAEQPHTDISTDIEAEGDGGREQDIAAEDESTDENAPPYSVRPAPALKSEGVVPSAWAGPGQAGAANGSLLGALSLPVLIHAGDRLFHANRAFFDLTGYSSLDQIEREGGLERLFADSPPEASVAGPQDSRLLLRTLGGEEFPVDAHLQSVPWNGGKALLLSLRRVAVEQPDEKIEAPATADPAVEEMKRHVAEMRTIIDTATDGVVLISNDGTIRNISRPAEALFGCDSAEVEGKHFATLFAIESQRAARDYLNGMAENGVASVLNDGRELIGREAAGRFIPLFMTIGRLPLQGGYCAVVRDITQWKRAEEELTQARAQAEHASSQKTEFLARVSHEIRTPLNAIIGFSELMVDEKFGPIGSDRYRDYLRDINRSGNHVLDLVNDLLDISKIEAGEQEMHYEAVSLNESLAETVAMMQPQANRERVIIRSSLASRLPDVVADLRSVRQIILNLLSNALRYTQAGGQVIVSTTYEASGEVMLRVRDTGIGMTLSEIDQALKPFKQINALKRGRNDGTGLGLPLTKAMVEANRARFAISSSPGEGTLVEITFPSTRVLAE